MLGIVVPLKSSRVSGDWAYDVWLLQRVLDSILAQTNAAFTVAVVCHETPSISQIAHEKIRFIEVDFPPPPLNQTRMHLDKVLKLSVGAEWAKSSGYDYVMFNDSDDLVYRGISEFVETNGGANGWYSPTEIFYAYGSKWVLNHQLPATVAGPCVIIRSDLMKIVGSQSAGIAETLVSFGWERQDIPTMLSNRPFSVLAAVGHTNYRQLMENDGHPLAPLPFSGNVVINHSGSTSQAPQNADDADFDRSPSGLRLRERLGRLKRFAPSLLSLRPVTRMLREDFTIPAVEAIPAPYTKTGSIFDRVV